MTPSVLLTGGAGYIGSHTLVALKAAGFQPVVLDDFSNSHPAVLHRLATLTGTSVVFERASVEDVDTVAALIERHKVSAVVHFAGLKAVGESVAQPLRYYAQNVGGTVSLLAAMQRTECRTVVFSSSATVYGEPARVPITEDSPRIHTNPYGHTKLIAEDILTAVGKSDTSWHIGVLRYFNPVGAHGSGQIGESPKGIPNNLMPYLSQVAAGCRPILEIFGGDYPTHDGTGVRDYLHVCDLAQGHVAAVRHLLDGGDSFTVNLGTGRGSSVLDVVRAFESASGKRIAYRIIERRSGDVAFYYADADRARVLLGWTAKHSLEDMCRDTWRWQLGNPNGYNT